nr:hypothetical protein [Tanacetum cinerariifolium]
MAPRAVLMQTGPRPVNTAKPNSSVVNAVRVNQINVVKASAFRLEEFQQPEFESYGPKSCKIESKNASENIPNEPKESTEVKESSDAPLVKDRVSDNKDCIVESPVVVENKNLVPTDAKIEFIKAKQQEKLVRKPVKYAEMYMS